MYSDCNIELILIGYDRFLRYPFQFLTHQPPHHSPVNTITAISLNKSQRDMPSHTTQHFAFTRPFLLTDQPILSGARWPLPGTVLYYSHDTCSLVFLQRNILVFSVRYDSRTIMTLNSGRPRNQGSISGKRFVSSHSPQTHPGDQSTSNSMGT
jgi:hypothetical protein